MQSGIEIETQTRCSYQSHSCFIILPFLLRVFTLKFCITVLSGTVQAQTVHIGLIINNELLYFMINKQDFHLVSFIQNVEKVFLFSVFCVPIFFVTQCSLNIAVHHLSSAAGLQSNPIVKSSDSSGSCCLRILVDCLQISTSPFDINMFLFSFRIFEQGWGDLDFPKLYWSLKLHKDPY